jgi:hypothetical protein
MTEQDTGSAPAALALTQGASEQEESAMDFRIRGLDPGPFRYLYGLADAELAAHGAQRHVADAKPGYPDRVELRDADPGETLLLLNFIHQPAETPYRASHAIFVREGAEAAYDRVGDIPEPLRVRPISLRAFDTSHYMVEAELVPGTELCGAIAGLFSSPRVGYLHAHYAKRGCYAARIERR